MHHSLGEINLVYNGQKLAIHAELKEWDIQSYPILSYHDIHLKVTCLSLAPHFDFGICIDLNNFPKLETFYGVNWEMIVDHEHPSLKDLYLDLVTFRKLPINLKTLVASSSCTIEMNEDHPKLPALRVLVLEGTQESAYYSMLLQILWNKDLEHFSYCTENATNKDEIFSMIGPKVKHFEFFGRFSSRIPTLLRSLYNHGGKKSNMTAFTHMTSLTLDLPQGSIAHLRFPPNLLKLSITFGKFKDLAKVDFPPKIVDLALEFCDITLAAGWLKPAGLKRLSLSGNKLSSFKVDLPCCEFLYLKDNSLTDVEIEAPALEHIDISENKLTSFPSLPGCLKVLILSNNELDLSQTPQLPSNVRRLDLLGAGTGTLQNYTFPSSLRELHLTEVNLSGMSGVKFARGSKLKYLNLSSSSLNIIDDNMIELPPGLEMLDLFGNNLQSIDDLTIPQTVKFLDLGYNNLESLKVEAHIEILNLNENPIHLNFTVAKNLELRVLDLMGIGLTEFSFD